MDIAPITTWEQYDPAGFCPAGRNGHTASVVGGRMVVFGGAEGAVRTNSVAVYDVASRKWSLPQCQGSLPAPRSYHVSWVQGREVFIHGGESGEGRTVGGVTRRDSVDTVGAGGGASVGSSHRPKPRPASASRGTSAASTASRFCFDDVYALNTDTMTWRAVHTRLAPLPRKCHSACVLKAGPQDSDTVFLFGGITAGSGEPTNDLFRLDLVKLGTWQCMWMKGDVRGVPPPPRSGHTATAVGDKQMAVFGGACGASFFSDMYILSMHRGMWERVVASGVPPTPRHGHCTTLVENGTTRTAPMLVVFGGIASVNNQQHFPRDLFLFDVVSRAWGRAKVGHSFPSPRYGHSMVCVPSFDEADGAIELRHAELRVDVLLFGGLNSMYCPGNLWGLHVVHPSLEAEAALVERELKAREPAMARTMPPLQLDALQNLNRLQAEEYDLDDGGSARASEASVRMLPEDVGVGILELKKRLNMTEERLLNQEAARVAAERERDELKALLKTATTQLASQRSTHLQAMAKEKARCEREVEEARSAQRQAKADLKRAVQLLCLHDLAAQMRLEVWQRRHANRRVIAESKLVAGTSWGNGNGSGGGRGWPASVGSGGGLPPVQTRGGGGGGSWTSLGTDRVGSAARAGGRISPITAASNGSHPNGNEHRSPVINDSSAPDDDSGGAFTRLNGGGGGRRAKSTEPSPRV